MTTSTRRAVIRDLLANLPDHQIDWLSLSFSVNSVEAFEVLSAAYPDLTLWEHETGGATMISPALTVDVPPHVYEAVTR